MYQPQPLAPVLPGLPAAGGCTIAPSARSPTGRGRVYLTWSLRYGLSNQLYRPAAAAAAALLSFLLHASRVGCPKPAHRRPLPCRCCFPLCILCSHVNGLALVLMLGVDGAILPPAVCRATFNTTLAHLADDGLWSPQPLSTLLDVGRMQAHCCWCVFIDVAQPDIAISPPRGIFMCHWASPNPSPCSAFSYLARELRQLGGQSPSSSLLHPPEFGGFWQDGLMEVSE